jgi:hypothetical protein
MDDGLPYIDSKFYDLVEEKMAIRSSVSIIHYYPVPAPESAGENDTAPVIPEEAGEDGVNVPSAVHQGTSPSLLPT